VDEDQLSAIVGGKNTNRLVDNVGPWSEYEIVDGYKQGDKVGIRRRADGPNGPVFTP